MTESNNFHALLIGVAEYMDSAIPDLPATINDVRVLAEILTNPFYCCYPNNQVRLLTNNQATSIAVREALQQLANVVTKDSTVLVYFSGHGGRKYENNIQRAFLCTYDADPDHLETTTVSGTEFDALLAAIPAQKLLVILDACHASGAAKLRFFTPFWREGLPDKFVQELAQGSGRVVIASSKENQLSWNRSGNEHGLFTWFLLDGLKGEAARLDNFVRVLDLYDYVSKRVTFERSDQEPVLHARDVDANFPVALARTSSTLKTLSRQMRAWFVALKYEFESHDVRVDNYFEWIIKVPIGRRRYKYVLVRGIEGEIGVREVISIREVIAAQDVDEGWLVTTRQVSPGAREAAGNSNLFCYTFDELLDEDADFDGYLDWIEAEVKRRGIDKMYIPLACVRKEFDFAKKQKIGVSLYDEDDGWIEGYIDRWLTDPTKMHISILGEFGTGKTWFALHYAWQALKRYREAKAAGIERPRLPIVISLRDYAKALNIEFLFSDFFFRKHEIPLRDYSAFDQLNRMGKLLLIFDGFDEMADKVDRQKMINNFWEIARVAVPESKIILTCRTEHFPEAQEGRALLNAELQASTSNLTGEPPQFEVLHLEQFNDAQIMWALTLRTDSTTVKRVMDNKQLLHLVRRPLMTELILEALPEISNGKAIDLARVYLYAVRQKMERDIRNERTFTSLADKLYFLCEISWEMLSNDKMSLNYRLFPDRIRQLFGPEVQEQKDLDHWHYDMMGQTMLIPNDDGDYTPAHRSLIEFFVAYKFTSELGLLAPDFTELASLQSHIDKALPSQFYTWSSYFHRNIGQDGKIKRIPSSNGFVMESLQRLSATFGKMPISKAILDFMSDMLLSDEEEIKKRLLLVIQGTRDKTIEDVNITAGNFATLVAYKYPDALKSYDFSGSNLSRADFGVHYEDRYSLWDNPVDLSKVNFEGANLQNVDFSNVKLTGANLSNSLLHGVVGLPSIGGHFYDKVAIAPNNSFFVAGGIDGEVKLWYLEDKRELTISQKMSWISCVSISPDSRFVGIGDNVGHIIVYDIRASQIMLQIHDHNDNVADLAFNLGNNYLIAASGGNPPEDNSIRVYEFPNGKLNWHFRQQIPFHEMSYCISSDYLYTLNWKGGVDIWNVEKGLHVQNLIAEVDDNKPEKDIWFDRVASIKFDSQCRQMLVMYGSMLRMQIFEVPSLKTVWGIKEFSSYYPYSKKELIGQMEPTCALSHNALLVAFSIDDELILWDVVKNEALWNQNGHMNEIESIIFSPDDSYVITVARDNLIRFWDIRNGKPIETIVTNDNYKGLKIKDTSGLSPELLEALKARGAVI